MHYTANILLSFDSIEYIMRDVNNGWMIRYVHLNGVTIFFMLVYLHISKAIYYGTNIRSTVWYVGIIIYIVMMATAFLGYILPWGQMSYWGACVITN
jgi:ubiquinol-cytochrome c reductase cytochrome b subunit